jgi:hypothetical protein
MRTILAILVLFILLAALPTPAAAYPDQWCGAEYYFPIRAEVVIADYSINETRLVCKYPRIPRWMMPDGNADLFCRQLNAWPLLRSQRTDALTRCVYWLGPAAL